MMMEVVVTVTATVTTTKYKIDAHECNFYSFCFILYRAFTFFIFRKFFILNYFLLDDEDDGFN